MTKYVKLTALLTAAALLCGCSGNTSGDSQTSASEAQTSEETVQTSEPQSPAGESVPEGGQEAAPTAEAPEQDGASGVTLVSGGNSRYADIFELNGTWCGLTELPFEVASYEVPMLRKDDFRLFGVCGRKLYFTEWKKLDHYYSDDKLWSFDPATGEEKLVYSSTAEISAIEFVNDQYVVAEILDKAFDYEPRLTVVDLRTGKTVLDIPERNGNISYLPGNGVQIVYDMMYITAEYTMPEFSKTLRVGLRVYLPTGEAELYGLNYDLVDYGVGNVCYANSDVIDSIYGVSRPAYGEWNEADGSYTWYNMRDTYFITYEIIRGYDVLGDRSELFWTDRNGDDHRIGETAFSVDCISDQIRMDRDNIFFAMLHKYYPTVYNEQYDYYETENRNWLLLGYYDTSADSAQAALLDIDDVPQTFAENDCLYLVYQDNGIVTLICKEG